MNQQLVLDTLREALDETKHLETRLRTLRYDQNIDLIDAPSGPASGPDRLKDFRNAIDEITKNARSVSVRDVRGSHKRTIHGRLQPHGNTRKGRHAGRSSFVCVPDSFETQDMPAEEATAIFQKGAEIAVICSRGSPLPGVRTQLCLPAISLSRPIARRTGGATAKEVGRPEHPSGKEKYTHE
ncbi:MAG TPA: hypothetical protein VGF67_08350 [Ktedonobacteraceae bacterium]|jgi:hypothetical protein